MPMIERSGMSRPLEAELFDRSFPHVIGRIP